MNEILPMIRIWTSFHSCFCSSDNDCFVLLIKAAVHIVTPPNSEAADPVYAVKRNALSLHKMPTAWKNLKQNLCATVTAVLFQAPAGPGRNIISCFIPPLAFNFALILLYQIYLNPIILDSNMTPM